MLSDIKEKSAESMLSYLNDKLKELEMKARRNAEQSRNIAALLDQPIQPDTIRYYETGRRVHVFYYGDSEKLQLTGTTLTVHSCTPMGIYGFDLRADKEVFISWRFMAYHRPAIFYREAKGPVSTRFSDEANAVLAYLQARYAEQEGVVKIIEDATEEAVGCGAVKVPDDWIIDWATNIRDAAQNVIDHLTPEPKVL